MTPQCRPLDTRRWHFQHGPIDIVAAADGDAKAVAAAHAGARARFETVLGELVAELPVLRRPVDARQPCPLQGMVARRMWQACAPYAEHVVTPMAAVAGAVAETLIESYRRAGVRRAWVNNGGDIALHLGRGESLLVGLYADLARLDIAQLVEGLALDGTFEVHAADRVHGVATSGWRGRSFSFGIADSVTVLAATAAEADAAATVIANGVDVDHPSIVRRPANLLRDDTDLGDRAVTVDVPALPLRSVEDALDRGERRARELRALGLIHAAALVCQGRTRLVAGVGLGERSAAACQLPTPTGSDSLHSYRLTA